MAGLFNALKLILPGIFADRDHWRERALNAEAQVSGLISQYDSTIARKEEEWRIERAEILGRMRGDHISLPGSPLDDGRSGEIRLPAARATNPIARVIAEARAKEQETADKLTDDMVNILVDDILMANASVSPDNHDRGQ